MHLYCCHLETLMASQISRSLKFKRLVIHSDSHKAHVPQQANKQKCERHNRVSMMLTWQKIGERKGERDGVCLYKVISGKMGNMKWEWEASPHQFLLTTIFWRPANLNLARLKASCAWTWRTPFGDVLSEQWLRAASKVLLFALATGTDNTINNVSHTVCPERYCIGCSRMELAGFTEHQDGGYGSTT